MVTPISQDTQTLKSQRWTFTESKPPAWKMNMSTDYLAGNLIPYAYMAFDHLENIFTSVISLHSHMQSH